MTSNVFHINADDLCLKHHTQLAAYKTKQNFKKIFADIFSLTQPRTYIRMYVRVYVCSCIYICVYVSMCLYIYVCMCVCVCVGGMDGCNMYYSLLPKRHSMNAYRKR
jgi:hypothetical protein